MYIQENLPRGEQVVSVFVHDNQGNLKQHVTTTNARVDTGAQAMVTQMFGTVQPAPFNFVALSTSTAVVNKTDTAATFTAAGEITINGLARKQAAFSYNTAPTTLNGNSAATLTVSWTSSGAGTIGSVAAMNAASGGTMALETVLPTVVNYQNTDTVTLTWGLSQ